MKKYKKTTTESASTSADTAKTIFLKFIKKADIDNLLALSLILLKSGNNEELRFALNKEIFKRA